MATIDNRRSPCPWCRKYMRHVQVRQHIKTVCKAVPHEERERLMNPKEPTWKDEPRS